MGALSLGTFTFVTTESLPIGLLTSMSADLEHSVSSIGFLVTGYAAVVVLASVPLTMLTRGLSRRTVLGGMLATLVVTALASAMAHSYTFLLVARLLTALAQALFWSVV
ncbi:MAG: transporter, family, inner rane transport protein, partial [Frankiaceae bacterium]|nr:transporter, family, inner rane transport protein [Frankiaceae bacterium]